MLRSIGVALPPEDTFWFNLARRLDQYYFKLPLSTQVLKWYVENGLPLPKSDGDMVAEVKRKLDRQSEVLIAFLAFLSEAQK